MAGQSVGLVRKEQPIAEILDELVLRPTSRSRTAPNRALTVHLQQVMRAILPF